MAAELSAWSDFNGVMVGAAAALAGLVIVAASINIVEIVKANTLTARLGAAIATLVLAITVGAVGLMPEVPLRAYGLIIVAACLLAGIFQVHAAVVLAHDTGSTTGQRTLKAAVGFLPLVAFLAGGALLVGAQSSGLWFLAAAGILAIATALVVAWVVLVEVLR